MHQLSSTSHWKPMTEADSDHNSFSRTPWKHFCWTLCSNMVVCGWKLRRFLPKESSKRRRRWVFQQNIKSLAQIMALLIMPKRILQAAFRLCPLEQNSKQENNQIKSWNLFSRENELHTQSPTTIMAIIPGCRIGHLTRTEYPSTSAKVKLQGITKPMIVTKKLQKKYQAESI